MKARANVLKANHHGALRRFYKPELGNRQEWYTANTCLPKTKLRIMFQLSPFLIGLWMIGFAINSFAEDGNCIGISGPISQQGIQLSACKCDKNIHKLSINEHTDLPLVAVCNYVKEDWGQTGDYFFKGNLLISGVITREETETFGDTVRFYGEAKEAQVLFNGSGPDLRFQDQNAFVSSIRMPTITSNARCWSAKASMRIESMYTSAGPGTDADGTYILQYKMLNVGEFKKCKQSESNK